MDHSQQNVHHLIDHYMSISHYRRASELIYLALAEDPLDAHLHYQAALAYFHLNEHETSRTHLQQAYQSGYPPIDVHYLLGIIYASEKQWSLAEECYLAALAIHSNAVNVLASYASLLIKVGQRERGLELLAEARRIDPNNTNVLKHSLYYDIARNHDHSKMMHLEKLVTHQDDESALLVELGIKEFYSGNYKLARSHFREAYIKNPTNESLLRNVRIAERKANALLFPYHLADRIGGMPFLWFWITVAVLGSYPFVSPSVHWPFYAAIGFMLYLIFANVVVQVYYEAKDTNRSFLKTMFGSPTSIRVLGLLAGILFSIATLNPLVGLIFIFGSRLIANKMTKRRSLS
ncbi:TPR repeat-containing protein [Paenibacillus curdlanolyticus YK9]|uniref:TPR repeat-containing protein n=1 Tax=Paenibacillus curdlanolyticus YK9 TaxID=717606 RepID=E0ICS0_9BACL|nr:hypothetical protein [Paenibacillus curdlanolyticus]EFM09956.1 TPR repeat-containing protein [Paenibacillus curdlanolyticus YK9]